MKGQRYDLCVKEEGANGKNYYHRVGTLWINHGDDGRPRYSVQTPPGVSFSGKAYAFPPRDKQAPAVPGTRTADTRDGETRFGADSEQDDIPF